MALLTAPTPLASLWSQALPARAGTQRRIDLDALRGIAIFLVVVGHVVARDLPLGNDWYAVLKDLIYRFHMPLFMVLTGMTFGLSVPAFASWREARAYSWRRSARLAVPYFAFGLLIMAGKLGAAQFVHVDNPPSGSLDDVARLLFVPARSAASFLWFIYVLAAYLLLFPSLLWWLKRRPLVLLPAAIALSLLPWPQFLMLDRVMGYAPFYVLGIVLCLRQPWWSPVPATVGWPSVAAFVALLALAYELLPPDWIFGVLSVPALLTLVQRSHRAAQRFWAFIGMYSMSIYLMNTLAIGVTKGVMLKWHAWDDEAFLVFFPVLLLAGCALPVVVKRFADRHLPRLARYL